MRVAAALLALLLAQAVDAQGLRYRLEVEAPRELAGTLRKGLNLARWQNDPQMNPEQLRRLVKDAEREAREAAATEGYFSAKVETRVDETAPEWKVTLKVEPGPRTRVAHVEIRFSGPATQDREAQYRFKEVRENWRLRRGEPFRQADWDAAKRAGRARAGELALRRGARRRQPRRDRSRDARGAPRDRAGERPGVPLRAGARHRPEALSRTRWPRT